MTSCRLLRAATKGMRQGGTDDREPYGTETQPSNRTLRGISSGTFLNLITASHLFFLCMGSVRSANQIQEALRQEQRPQGRERSQHVNEVLLNISDDSDNSFTKIKPVGMRKQQQLEYQVGVRRALRHY